MKLTNVHKAALYKFANIASICTISALSKLLTGDIPIIQSLFLYKAIAFLIVIGLYKNKISSIVKNKMDISFLLRGVLSFVALVLWFESIRTVNLVQATTITYLTPIFTTIIAGFILKELFRLKYILATIFGFVGILLVLKPSIDNIGFSHFAILISTLCWAIHDNLLKKETRNYDKHTILFYTFFASFLTSLPFGDYSNWVSLSIAQYLYISLISFLFVINFYFLISATEKVDLVIIMPLSYSKLLINSIYAYFLFNETVELYCYLVAGFIIIGNLFIYLIEEKKLPSSLG